MIVFALALRVARHSIGCIHEDYTAQLSDVKILTNEIYNGCQWGRLTNDGGAFSATGMSLVVVTNCTFLACGSMSGDPSTSGGAAYLDRLDTFVVTTSNITGCMAGMGGGGFYFVAPPSTANFTGTMFQECNATGGDGGGVCFAAGGTGYFENCCFSLCETTGRGAGIGFVGAGGLECTNCTFRANKALNGRGIFVDGPSEFWLVFVQCQLNAATNGSSLFLNDCRNATIASSALQLDNSRHLVMASVVLAGSQHVVFGECCFSSTATRSDIAGAHISSTMTGTISFVLPMCFDLDKESSL
jgi:hypothetical protein